MNHLPAMSNTDLEIAYNAEYQMRQMPQIDVSTTHSIHSGVYTRTLHMAAGNAIVGVHIIIPTTLIITGNLTLTIGDNIHHIVGTQVIAADANRKQIMVALEDTAITMIFKTDATTIEEAEMEFTDQYDVLASRLDGAINNIIITGV